MGTSRIGVSVGDDGSCVSVSLGRTRRSYGHKGVSKFGETHRARVGKDRNLGIGHDNTTDPKEREVGNM